MRIACLVIALLPVATVAAHEGTHAAPAGPSGWDVAALAALLTAALLYARGTRRLMARGATVRTIERAAFWAGWVALVGAVAPPLDRAAAMTFSMHMAQHELLMLIGAPLVIVGRPILPWLWAMPARLRPRVASGLQRRPITRAWQWATLPIVAWSAHGLAIWIWHAPPLYEAAVESEAVHALQHATFVGTAVLFWWGLVYGRYGRAAYGASVLYVFTTMVHTGLLGAVFALSTSPFYGVYRERAAMAGIDPVTDQQLSGLYMWIPAGVVLTVSGLALLVAWISEAERRVPSHRKAIVLFLASGLWSAGGCSAMPHERDTRQLTGGDPYRGRALIQQYGCDTCHTIPGVATADATVGPPLTAVARRLYLAGHIENTPENMMRWIEHPRKLDAKTVMPEMGVTPKDSRDIVAYLYTLR